MKKHIVKFLALAVALTLLGCAQTMPDAPTEPMGTEASTEASTEPKEMEVPAGVPTEPPTAVSTEPAETAAPTKPEETEAPTEAATEHKHTFRGKVTKEPTCSASGSREYTCTVCGEKKRENIAPLDHAYVITTLAPSCTESGHTQYVCKTCGYSYMENIVPALGHSFGAWITVQNPTEETTGIAQRTCTRCGLQETAVLPKLS